MDGSRELVVRRAILSTTLFIVLAVSALLIAHVRTAPLDDTVRASAQHALDDSATALLGR